MDDFTKEVLDFINVVEEDEELFFEEKDTVFIEKLFEEMEEENVT